MLWYCHATRDNGKCQGIGRIGRLRHVLKLENPTHHGTDLFLGGATGARDGCLDLARCMQAYRNSMLGSHQHRHSGGLRGAHHGLHIVLGKHSFDGDSCWPITCNPAVDRLFNGHQTTCDIQVG